MLPGRPTGDGGNDYLKPTTQAKCGSGFGLNRVVVGAGNPQARVMFIGEASRRDIELLGEPFVGKVGELLWYDSKSDGTQARRCLPRTW